MSDEKRDSDKVHAAARVEEIRGDDLQQIIDDLDAAEAYVTPYWPSDDDPERKRMVESLKRASSILCLLSDDEVSLLGEVERLRALDLCSVCGNAPLPSGRECVCAGTGTADGERHGLRIEAIRAQQEVETLKEVRADDKRVTMENYNLLWSLVYPDDPKGWEYPGQVLNHISLVLEEKNTETAKLREACKKALTCASLDSSVRELIRAALGDK